jgi:TetR/AcrR family fatty acid metabolism transcriptional regulator
MPRPQVAATDRLAEKAVDKATADGRARIDKRAMILDAAVKVFAEKGYYDSRVSDIAREAGIAYGLVYHYFKNKDEVLATIFEDRWEPFLELVDDIGTGPGPVRDRLVSVAALILNAYRVRPDWVKVLLLEIPRSLRFAQTGQRRAVGRLFEALTRVLGEAQKSGELRGDLDPRVASTLYIGGLETVLTALVLGVDDLPEDDEGQRAYFLRAAETIVEIFLNGFGGGGVGT